MLFARSHIALDAMPKRISIFLAKKKPKRKREILKSIVCGKYMRIRFIPSYFYETSSSIFSLYIPFFLRYALGTRETVSLKMSIFSLIAMTWMDICQKGPEHHKTVECICPKNILRLFRCLLWHFWNNFRNLSLFWGSHIGWIVVLLIHFRELPSDNLIFCFETCLVSNKRSSTSINSHLSRWVDAICRVMHTYATKNRKKNNNKNWRKKMEKLCPENCWCLCRKHIQLSVKNMIENWIAENTP